eukprot:2083380-Rhodomonas_salina.1
MDEAPSSLLTLSLMASSSASPSSARLFLGIAPLAEGWNLMGDACGIASPESVPDSAWGMRRMVSAALPAGV